MDTLYPRYPSHPAARSLLMNLILLFKIALILLPLPNELLKNGQFKDTRIIRNSVQKETDTLRLPLFKNDILV